MSVIETTDEFIRLVTSVDAVDRRKAAWEQAPLSVWKELIIGHPEMRFWVAHNRTVPSEILRILALDTDWRVRHRVATKNACSGDILALLANDEHEAVASAVSGHPNTPTAALQVLARHPWSQVKDKAVRQLAERGKQVADVDVSAIEDERHT